MRYDDQFHLDEWRTARRFPSIHDAIFRMILEEATGDGFLDLCCSIGLLGQRIQEKLQPRTVVAIERDTSAIERSRAAGVTRPLLELTVTPETIGRVGEWIAEHRISTLVARRCLSEIFEADQTWGDLFVGTVAEAGIREFFIQGRQVVPKPSHPVPDVHAEIRCLGRKVETRQLKGECAYLILR